jgi:lysyl-tRNA synthetase class 2
MAKEQLRKERLAKLEKIRKTGIDPYPFFDEKVKKIKEVFSPFKVGKKTILAGRIRAMRLHGGSLFLDFEDGTGKMQAYLKKDELQDKYIFFVENFDVGDIILFKGKLFLTKKKEKTIKVESYKLLAKSLLPLPEKWHGLQDIEERFRKRYLDLLMSAEIKEKFILRAKIISEIRRFLDQNGFLEVETPILQSVYGGAAANPFKTYHNALNQEFYLRIAPELYLKRLIIGGFEKVYEIGRVFRNEGIDREHNPDFTMLEFYWAYSRIEEMMNFFERMLKQIVKKVIKKNKILYRGKEINFKTPFKKVDFYVLLKKKLKKDFRKLTDQEINKIAGKLKIPTYQKSRFKILDDIFKKACVPDIIQPTFVLRQPIELTPLAKRDKKDPQLASRFQFIVGGWELNNAFSELNDPLEQKERFEYEQNQRKKGAKETHPLDFDYIEALEYGMPPTTGFGMGLDRLVALLTDSNNLREVILFPLMRKKD